MTHLVRNDLSENLVDCLLTVLNDEGINYCLWKSNIDLAQATSGEMDLDFLVDRQSYQLVISILSRLGFKYAVAFQASGTGTFYSQDIYQIWLAAGHILSSEKN